MCQELVKSDTDVSARCVVRMHSEAGVHQFAMHFVFSFSAVSFFPVICFCYPLKQLRHIVDITSKGKKYICTSADSFPLFAPKCGSIFGVFASFVNKKVDAFP